MAYNKPTDTQVQAATKGVPFKKCPSCGNSIGPSQPYCLECKRLVELGMKDAVKQFVQSSPSKDTQEPQTYDPFNHAGYQDQIPSGKIPPDKERV